MPVSVHCISAAEDAAHLRALRTHTAALSHNGSLVLHDRQTAPAGAPQAQVVLVLLTPQLLADADARRQVDGALARGQLVVQLRVSQCDVDERLAALQALPKGNSWIKTADNDEAWHAVCLELKQLVAAVPAPPDAVLPVLPRTLVRAEDRRTLAAQLVTPGPSVLLGVAGLGKSTLLVAAMREPPVAAVYGSRRHFVRCDGATTRDGVVLEMARVLDVPLSPRLEQAVLARLREAPTLLALDNAETPWEADRDAVEDLLSTLAAAAKLVLTLRGSERPGLPFLPPLLPQPLTLDEARQVFLDVSDPRHAADPRLDLLIEAVGRLPLALALLGHRAETDPDLAPVWRDWQRQGPAAAARGQGRLNNLERSLELSIQGPRMRACPAAARLLSLLGFLPDGIAWDDLEPLLPEVSGDAARALRQVGLAFDEDRMLRVLAPIREHARRRSPLGREEEARVLPLYLTRAAKLGEKVGAEGGAAASARLTAEARNIESVIERVLTQGRHAEAVDALCGFAEFARFSGYQGRVVALLTQAATPVEPIPFLRRLWAWLTRTAPRSPAPRPVDRAHCLCCLGDIALARSDHAEARARFDAALPLFLQVGSLLGQANCIFRLGVIALERADHPEARARFDAALPLFHQVGSLLGQAHCIHSLGDIAHQRSDLAEARARYHAALALYQRIPEPYSIGWTQIRLARLCEDPQERRALAAAAFAAWRSIDREDLVQRLADEFPDAV